MIYLGHIKYMNCAIMEELEETGAAVGVAGGRSAGGLPQAFKQRRQGLN